MKNEMNVLMEELGTIQDDLTLHDFYIIDSKVEEVGKSTRACWIWDLTSDVTDLERRTENKSPSRKAPFGKTGYPASG